MQNQNSEVGEGIAQTRLLSEADVPVADRILRVAFGTFLGLPEPEKFMGDREYVKTRWSANPNAAFVAESNGEIVGSNFASDWGSVGFFGPLTIRPDHWDKGIGKLLLQPVMSLFEEWGTRHAGLFTFPHSTKHISLYHKFGFRPRFLTAIMSKAVGPGKGSETVWNRFSSIPLNDQNEILHQCRELTGTIYDGLNVEREIRSVAKQNLGDTVLVWNDSRLAGFAVCHRGAGTEAGSGICYVKFAAARPGQFVERDFRRLLEACESMAISEKVPRLVAGVNTARYEAYRQMLLYGFRADMQGVAMEKSNDSGYNRPDVYLIDDWR